MAGKAPKKGQPEVVQEASQEVLENIANGGKTVKYDASSIQVLEGLAPVRKRPGMYIGSTGTDGLHHMIWEVVDNAIDEAMAGHATDIGVVLGKDQSISVSDNGRGIPVDKHPVTKKSALETALTVLHAGGKFGGGGYKVSGGLHGVGVSVVNALSKWLKAEVYRDGKIYTQEFKKGDPTGSVKSAPTSHKGTGTTITWIADPEIFDSAAGYSLEKIYDHLRQQAYLTKGVRIHIVDENSGEIKNFYFEGGVQSYVRHLNKNKETLFDPPFYVEKEIDKMVVEISVQYTEEFSETVLAFANNIFNPEGGMHVTGFRSALTRVLNSYAQNNKLIKDNETLSGDDVREGMTAVISVKLSDPQFEGQTKAKLGNPEVRGAVESVFGDYFASYLEEHPTEARKILNKVFLAAKARLAARAARDTVIRKGMLDGLSLPGKLTDCIEKDASKSELFIVEGDSAGGNAKQGRDRHFQAILPLRGKILNVERARLDKMLANNEIKALVIALGAGIGTEFEVERMRYHRIVIMTDADVDGAHIRTLLLTFFFRYMAPAIEKGYIYIAQPPLYRVKYGNTLEYAYSDEEKDKLVEVARTVNKVANPDIQRYKGLGEMNADQLWETTMNPEHRVLKQVKIDDLEEIDQIMHTLMGDEVAPRKRFIQTHAKTVKNLDV